MQNIAGKIRFAPLLNYSIFVNQQPVDQGSATLTKLRTVPKDYL